MKTVSTIGLDIAKSVFQIHGIDAAGSIVIRQQLKRGRVLAFFAKLSPCVVGIEACAPSHHWARALTKLGREIATRFHERSNVICQQSPPPRMPDLLQPMAIGLWRCCRRLRSCPIA